MFILVDDAEKQIGSAPSLQFWVRGLTIHYLLRGGVGEYLPYLFNKCWGMEGVMHRRLLLFDTMWRERVGKYIRDSSLPPVP